MKGLAIFCIALLYNLSAASADYDELCSLFKKDTMLRVPGSCDQYIVCRGESGQIFKCPDQTKYDAIQKKCIENSVNTQLCENSCANKKDGTYAAHLNDCRAFNYCKNGQSTESHCQIGYHFDQSRQMCVYPKNSQCIQNVNNICELMTDKATLFRNNNDCTKYYKCEKGKLTEGNCNSLYFSVEAGKCVAKHTVSCSAHRAAANTCTGPGKQPFVGLKSDGATCRGYFICSSKGKYAHDLQPIWYSCPAGTFFDGKNQNCQAAIDVKCYYNRCDGRGNATVVSANNNCRNYLRCQNDRVVKELTCEYHYFFNERLGACTSSPVYDMGCDDPRTHS